MRQIEKLSTLNEIFAIKDRMSVIEGKCTISVTSCVRTHTHIRGDRYKLCKTSYAHRALDDTR